MSASRTRRLAALALTAGLGAPLLAACTATAEDPETGSSASAFSSYDGSRGNRIADRALALWNGRSSRGLCLAGVGDTLESSGAVSPAFPRLPSAVAFDDWARANPAALAQRGFEKQDLDINRIPRGSIITWRPGQCGYHAQYGHVEIVSDNGSSRACSDFCGSIRKNCGAPGIFVPVGASRTTRCPGGAGVTGGAIDEKYRALGGCGSIVGIPLTEERATPDGIGRYNVFEKGSIYWTEALGAHAVNGQIRDQWAALAWETGVLGYPITDELEAPDGVGRYNVFEKGSVYWTEATGAHEVLGAIRDAWKEAGWEAGALGYPTSGEHDVAGGRRSDFQHGSITWDATAKKTTVVLAKASP